MAWCVYSENGLITPYDDRITFNTEREALEEISFMVLDRWDFYKEKFNKSLIFKCSTEKEAIVEKELAKKYRLFTS